MVIGTSVPARTSAAGRLNRPVASISPAPSCTAALSRISVSVSVGKLRVRLLQQRRDPVGDRLGGRRQPLRVAEVAGPLTTKMPLSMARARERTGFMDQSYPVAASATPATAGSGSVVVDMRHAERSDHR